MLEAVHHPGQRGLCWIPCVFSVWRGSTRQQIVREVGCRLDRGLQIHLEMLLSDGDVFDGGPPALQALDQSSFG